MPNKEQHHWYDAIPNIKKLKNIKSYFCEHWSLSKFKKNSDQSSICSQAVKPYSQGKIADEFNQNNLQRFQRGKVFIEGSLDLHGLTREEAFHELKFFIEKSQLQNKKVILIITGKSGVLYKEVPRWFDYEPFFSMIVTTKKAKQQDGGEGALYLLLKKR